MRAMRNLSGIALVFSLGLTSNVYAQRRGGALPRVTPAAPTATGSSPESPPLDARAFLQLRIARLFSLAVIQASIPTCETIAISRDACAHELSYAAALVSTSRTDPAFSGSAQGGNMFLPVAAAQSHPSVGIATRFCRALVSTDLRSTEPLSERDLQTVIVSPLGWLQLGAVFAAARQVIPTCSFPPVTRSASQAEGEAVPQS